MSLNIDLKKFFPQTDLEFFVERSDLDLSENLNRCGMGSISLELNWFSINPRQFFTLVGLLELLNQFFPLDVCF